jgi:hypothetical protein
METTMLGVQLGPLQDALLVNGDITLERMASAQHPILTALLTAKALDTA